MDLEKGKQEAAELQKSLKAERKYFLVRFFELDKHVAEDWVQCVKGINPYLLAALRLFFCLNTFLATLHPLVNTFSKSRVETAKFFFKLTHISSISVSVYFGLMSFLSFRHARDRTHWGPLRRFILNSMHFSCWMFQLIIAPIYWFALGGFSLPHPNALSWWQDFSVHGLAIIFLLLELSLVRRWYACWKDSLVSVLMMVLYMFWMWLAAFCIERTRTNPDTGEEIREAWWPYNIYRFGYRYAPIFYLVTLIGCFVVSLSVIQLHKWKNSINK